MNTPVTWIIAIVLVVLGGWYWMKGAPSADNSAAYAPQVQDAQPSGAAGINGSDNQTNTGQPTVAPVVTVAHDAKLGDYLVAANGMTLYLSTKDAKNVSNCSGACAVAWPPYVHTVAEPLVAGAGVTGTLATITRADGGTQLTYNGIPLYFYKNDTKAGDMTGQNVGGYWFVVKP